MALPLYYNVRNLGARWRVNLLAICGIALVVAVFVALAAMSAGFRDVLRSTGRTDNVMVVQKGATTELTSGFPRDAAMRVLVDERVARGHDGVPLASPEIVVVANLRRARDGALTNVTLRGVTGTAFDVRGGIRLVSGKRFTPGLCELLVGQKAASIFGPLTYGAVTLAFPGNHRLGIFVTGIYFVIGLLLLRNIDVERGRAAALEHQHP